DSGNDAPDFLISGPGNLAFDERGYAWVTNNTTQGSPNSCTFNLVFKPNGQPAGMALVFYTTPEAPVQCAVEIGRALNGNNPHAHVMTFPPAQPLAVYHIPSHRVAGRAVSFWLAHDRGNRYTVRMIASLSVRAHGTSGLYAMIPQSLVEKFRPCLVCR